MIRAWIVSVALDWYPVAPSTSGSTTTIAGLASGAGAETNTLRIVFATASSKDRMGGAAGAGVALGAAADAGAPASGSAVFGVFTQLAVRAHSNAPLTLRLMQSDASDIDRASAAQIPSIPATSGSFENQQSAQQQQRFGIHRAASTPSAAAATRRGTDLHGCRRRARLTI